MDKVADQSLLYTQEALPSPNLPPRLGDAPSLGQIARANGQAILGSEQLTRSPGTAHSDSPACGGAAGVLGAGWLPILTHAATVDQLPASPDNILEAQQENASASPGHSGSRNPLDEDSNYPQEDNEDESAGSGASAHRRKKQQKACFNELCKATDLYKRVKSKVQTSKYRTLCRPCHAKYSNGQFCEFCEQIYDDNTANEDDDLIWIGCDSCDRWNHIACEMKHRLKDAQMIKQKNQRYQCLNCSNKTKPKPEVVKRPRQQRSFEDPYQYDKSQYAIKRKTARQIYNEERNQQYHNGNDKFVDVFNRIRDIFPFLEQFLQGLNKTYTSVDYRIAVTDDEIKDDLQRFKISIGMLTHSNTEEDEQEKKQKQRKKK